MMTKKFTEKYNDSCVKLFTFIKMLYEDNAEFKKVINLFSDGNYDGTSNTHVTLNKYLNALKIFGVNVKKINNKYKMITPLYTINFGEDDLKSIALLKQAGNIMPKGASKKNFDEFLDNIIIRSGDKDIENLSVTHNEFYNSTMVEQIKSCEKYCQDNLKLEIVYNDEEGNEINLVCSPIETVYLKHRICLKTMGNNGSRVYEIPLDSIKSISQMPSSSNPTSVPTTVVYRIKNRLAKNYKIRDWERLDKIESDGSHIIVNKNEDFDILIRRLMKYGTECEVISPKFIKEEIINLINKTLSNYQ